MMCRLLVALALLCPLLLSAVKPCGAATRPGAPRALALSFGSESRTANAPLVSEAVPLGLGNSYVLLFSGGSRGTRNIYRATAMKRIPGKPIVWSAEPLTLLGTPNFVTAPAPFPDGKSALCVVGTLSDTQNRDNLRDGSNVPLRGNIARLDLDSGALETLVSDGRCSDPMPSPDSRRFAWSAERSGTESVWAAVFGGESFRVASKARHPVWLDAKTLLYESLDNGRRGIYHVTLKPNGQPDARRQLWPRGGEIAVSPDGDTLCLATQDTPDGNPSPNPNENNTRLYVLSADGSGARALSGTEGARHPHWLPDGSGVVYDAPLADDKGVAPRSAQAPRALWLLPMRGTLPVSALLEVHPSRLDTRMVEIYGTAWCEGDNAPQVKLEVGRGDAPEEWQSLPAAKPPIQQSIVGRWMPLATATGTWTLRLTVTATSGETAQNVLPITLPLVAAPVETSPIADLPPAVTVTPPISVTPPVSGGTSPDGASGLPLFPNSVRPPGRGGTVAPMPLKNLPPRTPDPHDTQGTPLPPNALPPVNTPPVTGSATPNGRLPPALPPVDMLPPAPDTTEKMDAPPPLILKPLPRKVPPKTPVRRKENRKKRPPQREGEESSTTPRVPVPDFGDAARIDVAGTPAEMEAAETLEVVATLRNRGHGTWTASGANPVRLLVRWTDMTGGYRVRWAVVWPQTATTPGQTSQVRFPVTAPSRPGHYKVTYALLRVPGGTVQPPRESGDAAWPGEFGGAAYEVTVK